MIIMGIHQRPHLANYWSSDPFFVVSAVAQVMSSKRYKKLLENIHLNDNTKTTVEGEPGYDKLLKVKPLVNMLNEYFREPYKLSTNQ